MIFEMSTERSKAIKRMLSIADSIMVHLAKIVIYGDSLRSQSHWIDEIADRLYYVNRIDLRTKSKRLKPDEYLDSLFTCNGDTDRDMFTYLEYFKRTQGYPDFEITHKLSRRLLNVMMRLGTESSKILSDFRNGYSKQDFVDLVEECIYD